MVLTGFASVPPVLARCQAFDALDIDRSGVINEDKLRQVGTEVGIELSHDDAVHILNQLDRDHKGEVTSASTTGNLLRHRFQLLAGISAHMTRSLCNG